MGANLTPAFGHPSPEGEGISKLPLSFRRGGWGVRFLLTLALASQALVPPPR
jgi:hypothetical protein